MMGSIILSRLRLFCLKCWEGKGMGSENNGIICRIKIKNVEKWIMIW